MGRQVGGDHYERRAIQPFEIIDAYGLDFYTGNLIKYILRHQDKGGVEDLRKAAHYLDIVIERAEASAPQSPVVDQQEPDYVESAETIALDSVRASLRNLMDVVDMLKSRL